MIVLIVFLFLGDIIGKGLAWMSLLPIFLVVAFVTLIIFRREIHTVSCLNQFDSFRVIILFPTVYYYIYSPLFFNPLE